MEGWACLMKMICFPHAGGFGNYYSFLQRLQAPATCCLIEYPGRGKKVNIPYPGDMRGFADYIMKELDLVLADDEPCILFGHSMGAFVAYEAARRLKGRVRLLIVSGQAAPDEFKGVAINCDSRADVINYIMSMGGSNMELFSYLRAEDFFIPIVQSDLRLIQSYRPELLAENEKPDAVAVLCGRDDAEVGQTDLTAWKQCALNFYGVKYFEGGHFYMNAQKDSVIAYISQLLSRACRCSDGKGAYE